MEYVSLLKKYYMSNDNGTSAYMELINNVSTIKFNISNKSYPFFVCINKEILKLVSEIYLLNGQLIKTIYGNKRLPNLVSDWILHHTFIEEIMMSNEIEGVVSTRKEIKEIMEENNCNKYKRLYGLVKKYQQLFESVEGFSAYMAQDIRDLYDKTMYKDVQMENIHNLPDGKLFRKESVEVVSGGRSIHVGLNPEQSIIDSMNEALNILNDESLCLLIRVAIFHYLFGFIHPFYDGNGRMARFISSAYLCKELDIVSALQISVSCKKRQSEYYESFKVTNDIRNMGDLTYFVISFLEIYKHGLEEIKKATNDKIEQYFYLENVLNELCLDKYSTAILNVLLQCTLFTVNSLTLDDLVHILGVSKSTIKNRLSSESLSKFLKKDKQNKSYAYMLDLSKLL